MTKKYGKWIYCIWILLLTVLFLGCIEIPGEENISNETGPPVTPTISHFLNISATSPHVADGENTSDIIIFVKDSDENFVIGANLSIVGIINNQTEILTYVDNDDGSYSASVVSQISGEMIIVVTDLNTGNLSNTSIIFEPGRIEEVKISAFGPRSLDDGYIYDITAYVADKFGNVVKPPKADVDFNTDLGTLASVSIDEFGYFTTSLRYDGSGTATITASQRIPGEWTETIITEGESLELGGYTIVLTNVGSTSTPAGTKFSAIFEVDELGNLESQTTSVDEGQRAYFFQGSVSIEVRDIIFGTASGSRVKVVISVGTIQIDSQISVSF